LKQREPNVVFAPGIGTAFPPFKLLDASGKTVDLAGLRGHAVLLEFVGTQCDDACRAQSAAFVRIQQDVAAAHMADRVLFVGISLDPEHDTMAARRAFAEQNGLDPASWAFLAGSDAKETRDLAARAGLEISVASDGSPRHPAVTYVIDGDGRLRARFLGLRFDPLDVVLYVNALLNDHHDAAEAQPAAPTLWARLKAWL
jgi:protein SCO1/2